MADFVNTATTKTAVRNLTTPIADLNTFNALVKDIQGQQPLGMHQLPVSRQEPPGYDKDERELLGQDRIRGCRGQDRRPDLSPGPDCSILYGECQHRCRETLPSPRQWEEPHPTTVQQTPSAAPSGAMPATPNSTLSPSPVITSGSPPLRLTLSGRALNPGQTPWLSSDNAPGVHPRPGDPRGDLLLWIIVIFLFGGAAVQGLGTAALVSTSVSADGHLLSISSSLTDTGDIISRIMGTGRTHIERDSETRDPASTHLQAASEGSLLISEYADPVSRSDPDSLVCVFTNTTGIPPESTQSRSRSNGILQQGTYFSEYLNPGTRLIAANGTDSLASLMRSPEIRASRVRPWQAET